MSAPWLREVTARGSGGVAVLELCGEGALDLLARLLPAKPLSPGKLRLTRLALGGEELDEALVWCESPAHVELHLHASPPLVERVREELLRGGFAAWDGGLRLRSLEERASERLAHAPNAAGARMLLDQSEGALRRELERTARFSDEDLPQRMRELAERARLARFLLEPARVVLAGVVNAGKSTLFNALVGSERALVSSAPGTTRDVICEPAQLGQWPVLLYDTAGERALEPRGPVERVELAGQVLGHGARASADVVLWLCPSDGDAPPCPRGAIPLTTRADLTPNASGSRRVPGSAGATDAVAAGPEPAAAALVVARLVQGALGLPERAWRCGEGVPFEPWMEAELQRAADAGDRGILERLAEPR